MDRLRPLGRTGLRVSPLGLGTTKFGRNAGVKYPHSFELPTDAQISALLDRARNWGINLIDTAPAYGTSEERIGHLLVDREQWVIATKVGETFEDGVSHFDFSREAVQRSVEESLRRLRTDWLDLVLLHSDGDDLKVLDETDALPTLEALRDSGKIRAIGASTKTVEGGLRATELCDVVMLSLSRADSSQTPVIESAAQAQVGVLVKKPLASGHDPAPGVALAQVAARPGLTSIVVGTLSTDHLDENAQAIGLMCV
ncbi:MAG: aldo/keto reductase [bacterium TMED88]|nr:aldo/keto reductase [Deltaproteobacteria bacterium]OUV35648.1 MAG: aldo/keto reductase [bacterium TMED88]